MMDKKSQITLFIIIGIMLLFSVLIIVYLQQQLNAGFSADQLSSLTSDAQPVKLLVDKCLEQVAIPGIYYMGTQGGYINPPLDSLLTENSVIPYYYNSGSNEMPSLTTLENQIGAYIERTLPLCANKFKQFSFEVSQEKPRATVRINEQNVMVKVFYPLTIKTPGKEQKIENFVIEIPVRLGHIYDVAKQVVDRQIKTPDVVDMAYLASFDVNVDMLPYNGDATVFAITDKRSKAENINYQLFFANRFSSNTKPELDFIPDFALTKGIPFEYRVIAHDSDGDAPIFSDNTDLFNINATSGRIAFTPSAIGTFDVTITAADGKGKQDSTTVKFTIQ